MLEHVQRVQRQGITNFNIICNGLRIWKTRSVILWSEVECSHKKSIWDIGNKWNDFRILVFSPDRDMVVAIIQIEFQYRDVIIPTVMSCEGEQHGQMVMTKLGSF